MAISPPGIFSDSVSGFYVMRSMEQGAPANHTHRVDEDDIARSLSDFTSWWTPGQYLVPWAFRGLGLDLGNSMRITVALAWFLGLAGYWILFRALGFSSDVAATSLAVIFSQSYVLGWGRFYHGGELLMWSYLPWFALLAMRFRGERFYEPLILGVALIFGIFLKSAFLIFGAAALGGIFLSRVGSVRSLFSRESLRGLGTVFLAVLFSLLAFWLYTSAGSSPAGTKAWVLAMPALRAILFAAAAPLASIFDLGAPFIPESESVEWPFEGLFLPLLFLAVCTGFFILAVLRFVSCRREYYGLAFGIYFGAVIAFSIAWSLDLLISFNVRHFRLAAILLVPGIVALLCQSTGRPWRHFFFVGLLVASMYSVWSFAFPESNKPLERAVGPAGFSHIYVDQDALDALVELDAEFEGSQALIGVPWPQMGLVIQHSRVFDMRTGLRGAHFYRHKVLFGEVDHLLIVLPVDGAGMDSARQALRAFRGHSDWRRIHPEVEGYLFMYSGAMDFSR